MSAVSAGAAVPADAVANDDLGSSQDMCFNIVNFRYMNVSIS